MRLRSAGGIRVFSRRSPFWRQENSSETEACSGRTAVPGQMKKGRPPSSPASARAAKRDRDPRAAGIAHLLLKTEKRGPYFFSVEILVKQFQFLSPQKNCAVEHLPAGAIFRAEIVPFQEGTSNYSILL
jgi:hypothetical protein